jgi:hypothetical protein
MVLPNPLFGQEHPARDDNPWTEHYHDIRIDAGIVNSLPQALAQFSQLPGMEGANIVGHKLTAR